MFEISGKGSGEGHFLLGELRKNLTKKTSILMLAMGVFFYVLSWQNQEARAFKGEISFSGNPEGESLDPLNRIGLGVFGEKREKSKSRRKKMRELLSGHPMENMIPFLLEREGQTVSFLVAIAKKESNWGKFSPQKDGRDCFNYWGYKGGKIFNRSGYGCFDSPEEAVETVGARVEKLIASGRDNPKEMVVWKCGYDCSWDDKKSIQEWIDDVEAYYRKMAED